MGLREIKKKKAKNAILNSARALFFEKGFDGTTIEEIAERAEVAVGTVYNYFESKGTIILSITARDTASFLESEFEIGASESALDALRRFVGSNMRVLAEYPRQLLRELIREAFSGSDNLGEGLIRQDLTLIEKLRSILQRLADSGRTRDDLDVDHSALVIYGIVMTSMMWFAADPERTSGDMKKSLDGMLEIVCSGLERKGDLK
jgi:AcrR family transcriptional regulator